MAEVYFDNVTIICKAIGVSRNSFYKAVRSGKVPKREDTGEYLLNCPYIEMKLPKAGLESVHEILEWGAAEKRVKEKKAASKKPRKKSTKKSTPKKDTGIPDPATRPPAEKPPEKTKTVRGTLGAKDPNGKSVADVTHLAKLKMEYEVDILKKKREEWDIKIRKANDEMLDRGEHRKIYFQTINAFDTMIRNSQGTGVGEKLNRLSLQLGDKSDRERVAAFNETYSRIIADVLTEAYKMILQSAGLKKEDMEEDPDGGA